jgi:hypothetical protein
MSHIYAGCPALLFWFSPKRRRSIMSNIVCNDCGSKKLLIWFNSKKDSRDLCDKCFLIDGKVKK